MIFLAKMKYFEGLFKPLVYKINHFNEIIQIVCKYKVLHEIRLLGDNHIEIGCVNINLIIV